MGTSPMITIAETKNKYARRAYIVAWTVMAALFYSVIFPVYFLAIAVAGAIDTIISGWSRLVEALSSFRYAWGMW